MTAAFDRRIAALARYWRLPIAVANAFSRNLLGDIAEEALRAPVWIPGFGTFFRSTSKARRIRNLQTGQLMKLGRTYRLGFKASKNLRGQVAK